MSKKKVTVQRDYVALGADNGLMGIFHGYIMGILSGYFQMGIQFPWVNGYGNPRSNCLNLVAVSWILPQFVHDLFRLVAANHAQPEMIILVLHISTYLYIYI